MVFISLLYIMSFSYYILQCQSERLKAFIKHSENMKMSRVFLVLGFVLIMAFYSEAQSEFITHIYVVSQSEDCCFSFFTGSIPPKHILNVKKTGSNCPQQGFM
ncbi:hypothetical protein QTP86_024003 [Hemibagrus guttatus]|nr:hypothetical protein QTP86_024003 [Hemibagrus guttatus]